jgi:hypothetical protein
MGPARDRFALPVPVPVPVPQAPGSPATSPRSGAAAAAYPPCDSVVSLNRLYWAVYQTLRQMPGNG